MSFLAISRLGKSCLSMSRRGWREGVTSLLLLLMLMFLLFSFIFFDPEKPATTGLTAALTADG